MTDFPTLKLLLEAGEPTLTPEVIAWLKKHAPRQYSKYRRAKRVPIMRGMQTRIDADPDNEYSDARPLDAVLITPTRYRPSRNTGDLYKVVLDAANPGWPRRGYSTICTTKDYVAMGYGYPYFVIPPDDTVVAMSNTSDIWNHGIQNVFGSGVFYTLEAVGDHLAEHHKLTDEQRDAIKQAVTKLYPIVSGDRRSVFTTEDINAAFDTWAAAVLSAADSLGVSSEQMKKYIDDAIDYPGSNTPGHVLGDWVKAKLVEKKRAPFVDFAAGSGHFKAEKYGMTLTKAADIPLKVGDTECWFEGPFVAIKGFDRE